MERLYGLSLREHLVRRRRAGQRFTVEETVDVLLALADTLDAVHRAGVAHRDLKPGNVMLAPGKRVVLMDFGIFLPAYASDGERRPLAGTPEYMAPEAVTQRTHAVDAHLADLYALGVLGFEMLTGAPPFTGDDPTAVLRQHAHSPAPD